MGVMEKNKILVVDDSRLNIMALTQILTPRYDVLFAVKGESAIESAEKYLPDIILLDVMLPDISGFEVLTRLSSSELTKDIPVIFITGMNSIADEEKGFALGAVDYITKPFHGSIVKARIELHLKMTRYIRTIERLCMVDPLTELSNRRGFDNQMRIEWERAVREKTPIAILMIDIDKFKQFNDTYGHPQGDLLLRTLAEVFKQTLKRASDLAARWGGEEFIVLLPNTDLSGAVTVAEEIRVNVEQTAITSDDGTKMSATVSIGANSRIPSADDSAADFISAADKALYTAKSNGRNRICSN